LNALGPLVRECELNGKKYNHHTIVHTLDDKCAQTFLPHTTRSILSKLIHIIS